MARTTKTTGRRGRPPLGAAEKKRRLEAKKNTPRQARRARSKNDDKDDGMIGLHVDGWWQSIYGNGDIAVIYNPATKEFRRIDLETGTMTRIAEPGDKYPSPNSPDEAVLVPTTFSVPATTRFGELRNTDPISSSEAA
jgi:hypothetical protein